MGGFRGALTSAMRWPRPLGLGLLAVVLVAGCAAEEAAPPPTELHLALSAVPSLNPDKDGRPSPVVVRLFELTTPTEFNQADFFDLFDNDRATLGDALVATDELEVLPADKRSLDRTLDPRTRFVGFLAAFREVEVSSWRAVAPVTPNAVNALALTLDSLSVSVQEGSQ
jgi:type VI secretion system protein VasD